MSVYFSISWGYKSTLTLSTCQINNWRGKITKRKKNIIGCVVYFIITIYRYIHLCTNIQFLHFYVLFTYLQFIRVAPGRECPYYLQSVIGKFSAPSSSMYRVCTGYVQGIYTIYNFFCWSVLFLCQIIQSLIFFKSFECVLSQRGHLVQWPSLRIGSHELRDAGVQLVSNAQGGGDNQHDDDGSKSKPQRGICLKS